MTHCYEITHDSELSLSDHTCCSAAARLALCYSLDAPYPDTPWSFLCLLFPSKVRPAAVPCRAERPGSGVAQTVEEQLR